MRFDLQIGEMPKGSARPEGTTRIGTLMLGLLVLSARGWAQEISGRSALGAVTTPPPVERETAPRRLIEPAPSPATAIHPGPSTTWAAERSAPAGTRPTAARPFESVLQSATAPAPPVMELVGAPATPTDPFAPRWAQVVSALSSGNRTALDAALGSMRDALANSNYENLPAYAQAVAQAGLEHVRVGDLDLGFSLLRQAPLLAPAYAEPWFALARAEWISNKLAIPTAAMAWVDGMATSFRRLPSMVHMGVDGLLVLAWGLMLFLVLALGALAFRYLPLASHEFAHFFPQGIPAWRFTLLGGALAILPLLYGWGLGWAVVLWAILAWPFGRRAERLLILLFVACLAVSPWALRALSTLVVGMEDPTMLAMSAVNSAAWDPQAERDLRAALARGPAADLRLAFGLVAKRNGDLDESRRRFTQGLLESPSRPVAAALHVDLGNVYFLQGDQASAGDEYRKALALNPLSGAAHYDLGQQLLYQDPLSTEGTSEIQRGRDLDPDRVGVIAEQALGHAKGWRLIDETLPWSDLWDRLLQAGAVAQSGLSDQLWHGAVSGIPPESASQMAVALLVVLLGLQWLASRRGIARTCSKCGAPVCPRCQVVKVGEEICPACYQIYVRREATDPAAVIAKEREVARHRRQREFLPHVASLIPGAGHLIIGSTLKGSLLLFIASLALSRWFVWRWAAFDPPLARGPVPPAGLLVLVALVVAWAGSLLGTFRESG